MQIIRFYDRMPTMECLQGDTLDEFEISVDDFDSLDGCTMQLILEDQKLLGTAKKTKDCTLSDGCFKVQLTSADTSGLHGVYNMHFRMKDTNGLSHRKLAGILIVKRTVQGS